MNDENNSIMSDILSDISSEYGIDDENDLISEIIDGRCMKCSLYKKVAYLPTKHKYCRRCIYEGRVYLCGCCRQFLLYEFDTKMVIHNNLMSELEFMANELKIE